MSLSPRSAQASVMVIGLLLILFAVTLLLHLQSVDVKLIISFVGVGLFLMFLAQWMMRRTGVVRVIKPYRKLGFGTTVFVLGVLVILGFITALLMNYSFPNPIIIGLESEPIRLPSLNKLLPLIGVVLMIIGIWINESGKRYVRLPEQS